MDLRVLNDGVFCTNTVRIFIQPPNHGEILLAEQRLRLAPFAVGHAEADYLPPVDGLYTVRALISDVQPYDVNPANNERRWTFYAATPALRLQIEPSELAASGAMWKVDQGPWLDASTELRAASFTNNMTRVISFKPVPGWLTPPPYNITPDSLGSIALVARYRSSGATQTYEAWVAAQKLPSAQSDPSADPDRDGIPNALEYAFGLNPQSTDTNWQKPFAGLITISSQTYFTYTYRRPKLMPADTTYWVNGSLQLDAWIPNSLPLVPTAAPVDSGDSQVIILRSVDPIYRNPAGFIQMRIFGPTP